MGENISFPDQPVKLKKGDENQAVGTARVSVRIVSSDRAASRTGGPQYPVPLLT